MSTAFATIAQRLGQRTIGALADATLTVGAAAVDGMLDTAHDAPGDLAARAVQFTADSESLADAGLDTLAEGDLVTVTRYAAAVSYRVAQAPLVMVELGQTRIDLARATL
jgi:hypothetical protein